MNKKCRLWKEGVYWSTNSLLLVLYNYWLYHTHFGNKWTFSLLHNLCTVNLYDYRDTLRRYKVLWNTLTLHVFVRKSSYFYVHLTCLSSTAERRLMFITFWAAVSESARFHRSCLEYEQLIMMGSPSVIRAIIDIVTAFRRHKIPLWCSSYHHQLTYLFLNFELSK